MNPLPINDDIDVIHFGSILEEIQEAIAKEEPEGQVAQYIPELAKVDPAKFGMHLCRLDGESYSIGDSDEKFSLQSITKVLTLTLAISLIGDKVWDRVGVEPSGSAFNSLTLLEVENGKPRNPLINSGALVIADILVSHLSDPKKDFLHFVRKLAGSADIHYNYQVAQSEKDWGYRNAALLNLMKSFGNVDNDIDTVLDLYFHMCSTEMSCAELSRTFLLYANGGKLVDTGERILSRSHTKRVNAIMQTCGFYDEAGEFSFKVGLPGKSGVGGGIVAIHPGQYSVAVWSPRLNRKGNSALGMLALERLTSLSGLSIF
ncbi:glutaminase [Telluribacter humicola]|uniref:glutaminase n=1 Tax=Telluribacter humicola TaxID=1720261 RepID=UPI001E4BD34F|nr:glutaminase [Telluribacter humicola]